MKREAILLAGGFGTRLQSVVHGLPKPMADVNGKPFLSYILDYLIGYNFEHIILSTGYMHECIENFYNNSYESLRLSYAIETSPLGTGGGILNSLRKAENKNVFVFNADTLFKADLNAFEQFFETKNTDLSVVLRKMPDVSRYSTVELDESNRIIHFQEKKRSRGAGFVNGGIYLLSMHLFSGFNDICKFSFEKDLMEKNYKKSEYYGFVSDAYFIDIGIPEDYYKAQKELS